MDDTTYPRLVGDIGGTNARFAWLARPGDALVGHATYRCADHATLQAVMRHHLAVQGLPAPRWCAIGIANPVTGDHVQMTNHDWSFSIAAVKAEFALDRFLVVNDFTALALSLPVLAATDLRQVGGGSAVAGAPIALIGAGTGLGVSGLLPRPDGRGEVPLNGEGGHVTLAAVDELERAVVAILQRRFGHASAERALSGPGLENLHAALCELDGVPADGRTAAAISAAALDGSDARCGRAVDLFLALLGTVAGNLALTLGARGGVYIGGGIVPRLGMRIDASLFRARFESKGRFAAYLQSMPTLVLQTATSPALLGAARALEVL
jgi:glucokinase